MSTHALSRVLRVVYPAAIALAAVTLAWTNSVQGHNNTLSQNAYLPEPDLSIQRSIASSEPACSLKDRFRLTNVQSCTYEPERWKLFSVDNKESFSSNTNSTSASKPN